jgi:hypothetical protein
VTSRSAVCPYIPQILSFCVKAWIVPFRRESSHQKQRREKNEWLACFAVETGDSIHPTINRRAREILQHHASSSFLFPSIFIFDNNITTHYSISSHYFFASLHISSSGETNS